MSAHVSSATKSKSSRPVIYSAVVVILLGVVAAAWYAEPLDQFFRLRLWDKQAPGRVVASFLKSCADGNEKAATAQLAPSTQLLPYTQNGKWIGYHIEALMMGHIVYRVNTLVPKKEIGTLECEYDFRGPGAAEVTVPDAAAKEVRYRLVMAPGGWKIAEILGGSEVAK